MGLLDIDLTRPRRVKAAGMFVCAALILIVAVAAALATGRPAALWVLVIAVGFAIAGRFWLRADRAAYNAEQHGQDPHLHDDAR